MSAQEVTLRPIPTTPRFYGFERTLMGLSLPIDERADG